MHALVSRHRENKSYGHSIERLCDGYRISWTVDRYLSGSRLRWPTCNSRDTDFNGACRFAKRWRIHEPEAKA